MNRTCTGCGRPESEHRVVCLDGEFVDDAREPWRPPTIQREGDAAELTEQGMGMGTFCPPQGQGCS